MILKKNSRKLKMTLRRLRREVYVLEGISSEIEPSQCLDEDKDDESPKEFMLMSI